jgi:hypothetical protein
LKDLQAADSVVARIGGELSRLERRDWELWGKEYLSIRYWIAPIGRCTRSKPPRAESVRLRLALESRKREIKMRLLVIDDRRCQRADPSGFEGPP